MPGIPSIYYGSEWGIEGRKNDTDDVLRPELNLSAASSNSPDKDLTKVIAKLAQIRKIGQLSYLDSRRSYWRRLLQLPPSTPSKTYSFSRIAFISIVDIFSANIVLIRLKKIVFSDFEFKVLDLLNKGGNSI